MYMIVNVWFNFFAFKLQKRANILRSLLLDCGINVSVCLVLGTALDRDDDITCKL